MQLVSDDALSFFHARLRSPRSVWSSLLPWRKSLTRRFALKLEPGRVKSIPTRGRALLLRCAAGRLWITHDGDCKDVVLAPGEQYSPDREHTMRLHAEEPSVVEFAFEDDAH